MLTVDKSVIEQAMEAIKLYFSSISFSEQDYAEGYLLESRKALCQAIEQAEQAQPVAVMTVLHLHDKTEIGYGPASAGYDLPTGQYKLYTTPPAERKLEDSLAPRQPLTDEQINYHRLSLGYDHEDLPDPWDFAQGVRAAERAHGIKGEA